MAAKSSINSFSLNTLQVDFESIYSLEIPSILEVFRSLKVIGLKKFLGGATVYYEKEVRVFFKNAKIEGDSIQCTVNGIEISIS